MVINEEETPPIERALGRIEAALERITRATERAQQARLDAAGQTARLEVRHEVLRERVGEALVTLDGLITRVEKAS